MTLGHDDAVRCLCAGCCMWLFVHGLGLEGTELNGCRCAFGEGLRRFPIDPMVRTWSACFQSLLGEQNDWCWFYFQKGLCCKCRTVLPAIRGTAAALRMSGKKRGAPNPLQKWERRSIADLTCYCRVLFCQTSEISALLPS